MFFSRNRFIGSYQDRFERASPNLVQRIANVFRKDLEPDMNQIGADAIKGCTKKKIETVYEGEPVPIFAPMDYALTARLDQPIGTDGLISCVAMALIDWERHLHSVAHITPLTEIKRLQRFVERLKGANDGAFLCEGPMDYEVLNRTYAALMNIGLPSIKVLEPETGLIVHNGTIFQIQTGQRAKRNFFDCDLIGLGIPQPPTELH